MNTRPRNRRGGSAGGQQVRVYYVIDVGEIPALLAVAVDRERRALEHGAAELRQDARILRGRILERAKNIEVKQGYCLHPIDRGEGTEVVLVRQLGNRVG